MGKRRGRASRRPSTGPAGLSSPSYLNCRGSGPEMLRVCWFAMRIIAGTLGSRSLEAPEGLATRPTSDRLRETLFNVVAPRIQGVFLLDLYAGSGAVGIEAL